MRAEGILEKGTVDRHATYESFLIDCTWLTVNRNVW
jgi:hypothetical protein